MKSTRTIIILYSTSVAAAAAFTLHLLPVGRTQRCSTDSNGNRRRLDGPDGPIIARSTSIKAGPSSNNDDINNQHDVEDGQRRKAIIGGGGGAAAAMSSLPFFFAKEEEASAASSSVDIEENDAKPVADFPMRR